MKLCGKIISKISPIHNLAHCLVMIFMLVLTTSATAQRVIPPTETHKTNTDTNKHLSIPDSINASLLPVNEEPPDTTIIKPKTAVLVDSTNPDSLQAYEDALDTTSIRISTDALPDVVTANASDSAVMDLKHNVFNLYGSAQVKYQDMQLDAHEIIYDQNHNLVTAALAEDSAVLAKGKPTFVQGKEKFTYDSLQYNFKSKRAIVRNVRSQYGEGFVHSEQVKRNPDQSIYGYHSVYTTCALDHPHFGIAAQKIKVVPGRVVASGPANVVIAGVPTPLFLPFGLFPISDGQRSGFKIPTYTVEEQRGLGLLGGGYYFNLSEKADLLVESNFYSKGSWATNALSNYNNRYHYSGAFAFKYAYNKTGESFESGSSITKDFNIQWTHRSDPKSRPGVSFNASVDAGTSTYNANNTYTQNQILQNQYQSNITFTKQWANKPYTLSLSARHSQNTQTRLVNVTLPELAFATQFNPFQGKHSTGTKWYDKINIEYRLSAINQTSFYDTTFSLDQIPKYHYQNGFLHTIPIKANYTVLRFLTMNISSNYKEYWNTEQIYRYYNTQTDKEDSIIRRGFFTARDFDAHWGFNTMIYGVKMFKKGKIAGVRHVLTPNVGLGYIPDYAAAPFYYGYKTRLTANGPETYLPVYAGAVPGIPGMNQFGKYRSALEYSLTNNLQMKVRSSKDSTGFKNIRLIDNFAIAGAYDLAADSFNWSNVNMTFATLLFNVINISANANFDPYAYDYENNRRSTQTLWQAEHKLVRFQTAGVSIGGSLHAKKKANAAANNLSPQASDQVARMMQYGRYNDYADFSIPFNMNFSYLLNIRKDVSTFSKKDTLVLSQHFLGIDGDLNITSRWKIGVHTGFDINTKQLQLTSIDIYRDLHCWEMRLSTVPFGPRKSYFFTLQVKAQVLQDLKLTRRRDYRDAL
ncbi:MAG: hypothetical protein BGO70_06115 [Bacteroidetes bacterium 43-93]|nr:MAG: hypothetical protein BGO70_06115 [Bacteroidetes bacterium 43-93]